MSQLRSYVGAVGIAVTDLNRSVDFYTRVLDMDKQLTLSLPNMDEVIVGFPNRRGAAVALMHYTDGTIPPTGSSAIKIILYVTDPTAVAAAIRNEGLPVTREPEAVPELGNAVVGFAEDPDGYTLELLAA